jgi:hypothetical protein
LLYGKSLENCWGKKDLKLKNTWFLPWLENFRKAMASSIWITFLRYQISWFSNFKEIRVEHIVLSF